ncbi:uncharacterized protein [Asterias amurensis]|uniref:uncharacterized protein n=1 Tax=Asterias amurensis TaxID=7602 RepID=UPI003AB77E4E
MDDFSDTETIVEESLDNYDSPSILTGLFHFRMETQTAEENKMYISDGEGATDCPVVNFDEVDASSAQIYKATHPESDPLGTDSADCQSEMSISILTSRVPKRMHSTVCPPDSPVFEHVLSSKFPRFHDVASSIGAEEETLCDGLQSSMGALHHEPSSTPSSFTTCLSQQDVLQSCVDSLSPDFMDLSQTVTTPSSSKSDSLLPKDNPTENSSKCQSVTKPISSRSLRFELDENPPKNPPECRAIFKPTSSTSKSLELEDDPPNRSECQPLTTPTASKCISLESKDNPPNASPTHASKSSLEFEDNSPRPIDYGTLVTPTHASKSICLELEYNPPNLSDFQADPSESQAVTTNQSRSTRRVHKDTQSEPPQHHIPTMQLLPNTKTPDGTILTRRMPGLLQESSQPKPSSPMPKIAQPISSNPVPKGSHPKPSSPEPNKIAKPKPSDHVPKDSQPKPSNPVSKSSQPKPSSPVPKSSQPKPLSPLPKSFQPKPSEEHHFSATQLPPRSKTPIEIAETRSSSSYDETLSVCVSKEEDEAVIEIKKMQLEIRQQLMHSGRDKNIDVGNIKKGLQDMQGKLRQLGTKQQEQRRQLSVKMKQQAASCSSSQSQLQQQEVKAQLQNMARRQQQLLKLLQSHKELAATLHTQCVEHRAKQQQSADPSQEHRNLLQDTSSVNRSAHETMRQREATVSNLTQTTKMKDDATLSSVEADTPVVLSQSIITLESQNTKLPTSKEARSFKPPFKAKQDLRMSSAHQHTANIMTDSPSRPGSQLESPGAEKTSSSAGYGSIPLQSPPFSQSSDISNGNFIPDTGNEREKLLNPRSNTAQDKPSQKPTCIQISNPSLNQSNNNTRRDNESNSGTINEDSLGYTNRDPQSLLPNSKGNPKSVDNIVSNSTVCGLMQAVSKTQTGTTLSGSQSLMRVISSAAGQSQVNLQAKQQAAQPPAKIIIISDEQLNLLQNIRAQDSTHHKNSVPVAPVRMQNTAPTCMTPIPTQEAQKVASRNPHGAAELPTANNPVGFSMLHTAPHSGTVSASSIQTKVSKAMELIQSTVTPDKYRDSPAVVRNPQGAAKTLFSTHITSSRPSTQLKEPGEAGQIPSMMDLLRAKLIDPGVNVLTIKGKKQILGTASLNAEGMVSPTTTLTNFNSGSLSLMVSLMKHKSLNWITNNPNIWKSVFYKETPLSELHSDYKDLIRSDPSQTVWKRTKMSPNLPNTQAAITTTTSSNILQPQVVTTSFANMSAPSIPKQPKPAESRDPVSSSGNHPASSSGLRLTSSHLDPTPKCQNPAIHPPFGRETVSRPHIKNPNSFGLVSRDDDSVTSRSHDLVSSLKRVLLISDDELMPSSWGTSPNFWSSGNGNDAIINPEWIRDIDVWS